MEMINDKALVVLVLWFLPCVGYSQECTQRAELIKVNETANGKTEIEVQVTSHGAFTGKVMNTTNSEPTLANTFSGNGDQRISIPNLYKTIRYTIILEFEDEKKFLCKTKVLPDIFLTDQP